MTFNISKATISDAAELNILVHSAYRGASSRQGWTTEADLLDGSRTTPELLEEIIAKDSNTILKYVENETILGCVEFRKDANRAYLGMLTVTPSLQGKGIGKILLNEVEKQAKQIGCEAIYMTVISTRTELLNWYKRHGYSETGERKPFQFQDERWGIPKQKLEFMVLEKKI